VFREIIQLLFLGKKSLQMQQNPRFTACAST